VTDTLVASLGEIDELYNRLKNEAAAGGYQLNPNVEFTKELVKGLLVNQKRYGYRACPCRLASGQKAEDIDIICPCYYRDPDLSDYGTCYCGLYVTREVADGQRKIASIPERRPPIKERRKFVPKPIKGSLSSLTLPVWRCSVCGYLCAREGPPEVCPICKASKDRFERFI
jgi:ferredoxin-thioredoxin reductase catalytic subunit